MCRSTTMKDDVLLFLMIELSLIRNHYSIISNLKRNDFVSAIFIVFFISSVEAQENSLFIVKFDDEVIYMKILE